MECSRIGGVPLPSATAPHPPPSASSSSSSLTTKTNLFFSSTARTKPLSHTLSIFPLLPSYDTVTWNTALSACLRHSSPLTALHLFHQMLLTSQHLPDPITFRSVLTACSDSHTPHLLPQFHALLLKLSSSPLFSAPSDLTHLLTCFLNAYLRFGFPTYLARQLFAAIPNRDVVVFTSMLKGLADAREYEDALRVFKDMIECEGLLINEHAYSCALNACTQMRGLFNGQQIHARITKSGLGMDMFVGTGLVDLYAKCDQMESASKAFSEILEPNAVSFNSLLAGNLEGEGVLQLFSKMRSLGVTPDHVTFASVVRACKDVMDISLVKAMHGLVVKAMEIELDVFLSCALFEAYINSGCFSEANQVFGSIKEKDDAAFNLGIQGYLRNGHISEALELFIEALKMKKEVREVNATAVLVNYSSFEQGKQLHALIKKFGCYHKFYLASSLIRMYCEYSHLDEAIKVFEQIPSPDLVLWTDLISNFSRCGENQRALNLYVKMITDGVTEPPNHYTFSALLRSSAHLAAATEGKQIHAQIIKSNLNNMETDPFVASALLYMYARCGYIEEARWLFNNMKERDLASWNAMITSLAHHGLANECIRTFEELLNQRDMQPNHISFVGVLAACSHAGLVELGYQYFRSIRDPTIDHYACLISLFGRAGRLKEAVGFVEEMPFEANEIIWSSLLAASNTYGNVQLGEYSAKKLLELNPKDPATYVSLSNIYAAAGKWDDMKRMRKLMKSQADGKCRGVSWLRVEGEELAFSADEKQRVKIESTA